jgi:hypothetical protein
VADVTLDIATKIVAPEQGIWSVFPGVGRRFLGQFIERNVIFLDTPGINLTRAALQDDELLRQHVAMSGKHPARTAEGLGRSSGGLAAAFLELLA